MSMPKLLSIFKESADDAAYSRLNNPVTVTKSGASLVVSQSIAVHDEAIVTFKAPCSCSGITSITVNSVAYALVDTAGNALSDTSAFNKGSAVSVILDTTNKKAYATFKATVPTADISGTLPINKGGTGAATAEAARAALGIDDYINETIIGGSW